LHAFLAIKVNGFAASLSFEEISLSFGQNFFKFWQFFVEFEQISYEFGSKFWDFCQVFNIFA